MRFDAVFFILMINQVICFFGGVNLSVLVGEPVLNLSLSGTVSMRTNLVFFGFSLRLPCTI